MNTLRCRWALELLLEVNAEMSSFGALRATEVATMVNALYFFDLHGVTFDEHGTTA